MNVLYIETGSGVYILDNKNVQGDTLGSRRVRLQAPNIYIPRKVYYNIPQMLHSKYRSFIDTAGKFFTWKKSLNIPLKYYRVSYRYKYKDTCIIHLKGIFFPQRLNCRLAAVINYVGVLHTEWGYVLYEFSETLKKDTHRKI